MMQLKRKQLFILMACINSMSESALRDLCRRFDFGNCNRAPIKNIKDRIKKRLTEHLVEPAVELPTDKVIPKDKKSIKKRIFATKMNRIFATKCIKLDEPRKPIRKVRFNG